MEIVLAEGYRVDSLSWHNSKNLSAACTARTLRTWLLAETHGLL